MVLNVRRTTLQYLLWKKPVLLFSTEKSERAKQGDLVVVEIESDASTVPYHRVVPYCTTKVALVVVRLRP